MAIAQLREQLGPAAGRERDADLRRSKAHSRAKRTSEQSLFSSRGMWIGAATLFGAAAWMAFRLLLILITLDLSSIPRRLV